MNFQTSQALNTSRWSATQASDWYSNYPWMIGFNYTPRSAINQLEMWQAETFDLEIIDQELSWASEIGFNMARVFLHHLPWQDDAEGFTQRIDQFLCITEKHNIDVMFVLFDDVWNPLPISGSQPAPRKGIHNSGWVQSPGAKVLGDLSRHEELEGYVRGIVSRYGKDNRVAVWDLYNEPGNPNAIPYGRFELKNKAKYSLHLLKKTFSWARDEHPNQPLTSGVWQFKHGSWIDKNKDSFDGQLANFMLQESDIITFHSYLNARGTLAAVEALKGFDRPMICTEYLARGYNNTFETILPLFSGQNIGAIQWGFVSGKTQTIFPWRSWVSIIRLWDSFFPGNPEPWHHDLLNLNGKPYLAGEIEFIKAEIMKKKLSSNN